MKVCKNCGEINSNDSVFCCNCGTDNFIFQEEITCPHCGAVNDKSFAHCTNCGNALAAQPIPAVAEPVAPQAEADYVPVPVDLRAELAVGTPGDGVSIPSETAKCPRCGVSVPITAIFCQRCGESVASLHEHRVVQRKVCHHCGRMNALDATYCSYCYNSLADAIAEDMQVVHKTQTVGEMTVRQAFLEDASGAKIICPNCGALNAENETFCVNCGLKLQIDEPKRYCPNCGAENSQDSAFCAKCRWSFDGTDPDKVQKWTCANCQRVNDTDDVFCTNCGHKRDDSNKGGN